MIQRHNRHMSISLYISALAVTDTIALLVGESDNYIRVFPKLYNVAISGRSDRSGIFVFHIKFYFLTPFLTCQFF